VQPGRQADKCADHSGTHRADGDLTFDADVEQTGAEADQDGETSKDIRCGFN
jgi:hypothetical protein